MSQNEFYFIRKIKLVIKASRFYWRSRNSASRFYWRSRKLSVSLLLALEETQRLASIGARRDLMKEKILNLLIVEDNERLRKSLIEGLKEFSKLKISYDCTKGEDAIEFVLKNEFDVLLTDVRLAGTLSGIETIVAIRKEYPRKPVVIYSIQDSDEYFRAFRKAGF